MDSKVKTKGLPFVVQPKLKPIIEQIGSEESGKIEIERRGYLTSGEKAFVQQAVNYDSTPGLIIGLARQVSKDQSMGLEDAYQMCLRFMSGAVGPEEYEIEQQYTEQLNELLKNLALLQSKEEILAATCLVKYRVDPDMDVADVMALHPDLITGLVELYRDEESRSMERLNNAMASDEPPDEAEQETELQRTIKKPRAKAKTE
jgi:hypothetical protein